MGIMKQFGDPRGLVGRLLVSGMNLGHTPMAKWGFTQFSVPQKGEMADIGCGGGRNLRRLLERSKEGVVYGVDLSPVSVEKSKRLNRKQLGKRCRVYLASAAHLPFRDASLDLVTAFETVYFWPDIEGCFREIRRTLKPGGRFAVVNDPGDPDKHWENMVPNMTAYTAEDIAGLMEQAGFADTKITRKQFTYCVVGTA